MRDKKGNIKIYDNTKYGINILLSALCGFFFNTFMRFGGFYE
jgi:hypothetical protein